MADGFIHAINERGFGFIRRTGSPDLFFHASEWSGRLDFSPQLRELAVVFAVGTGRDGRPCALNVRPAGDAAC